MSGGCIINVLILLVVSTHIHCQFYEFYQGVQPYLDGYSTPKPVQIEHTTRKTKVNNNRRHDNRQSSVQQSNNRYIDAISNENAQYTPKEKPLRKKQSTTVPNYNHYSTTIKPTRKTTSTTNNHNPNSRISNRSDQSTSTDLNRRETKVSNNISNNYTTRRNNDNSNDNYRNGNNNFNNNNRFDYNSYVTENPLLNKPGVRPTVVNNGPPITNRPVTRRPSFGGNSRPDYGETVDTNPSPELMIGMNEDNLSEVEKARYIEIAERMCDKYKALNMKQLQAIPLVPSPEPVNINISACAPTTIPLVVGGKVVSIKEFPHMALVGWQKRTGGYSWKCGGSLISDQYVLTAAHCAYQERDNNVIVGTPRAVQLGSSYLDDSSAIVVKIASVIRHPKYKLPRSYYDLALIKLVHKVQFSEVVKPACLGVLPREGKPVIATGWGRTEFGGDQSNELRSVSLPVWNIEECHNVLGTSRKLPNGPSSESQMCAGERSGGKDTCQGDSGGPAQIQDGCAWRVVAVTSLGRSCGAPHTPGLYAITQRAWISAHVFSNQKTTNYKPNNNNNYSRTSNNYGNNRNTNEESNFRNNDSYNNNNNQNSFRNSDRQDNYGRNAYNNRQNEEVYNNYNRNNDYGTNYNSNNNGDSNQRYNVVGVW